MNILIFNWLNWKIFLKQEGRYQFLAFKLFFNIICGNNIIKLFFISVSDVNLPKVHFLIIKLSFTIVIIDKKLEVCNFELLKLDQGTINRIFITNVNRKSIIKR